MCCEVPPSCSRDPLCLHILVNHPSCSISLTMLADRECEQTIQLGVGRRQLGVSSNLLNLMPVLSDPAPTENHMRMAWLFTTKGRITVSFPAWACHYWNFFEACGVSVTSPPPLQDYFPWTLPPPLTGTVLPESIVLWLLITRAAQSQTMNLFTKWLLILSFPNMAGATLDFFPNSSLPCGSYHFLSKIPCSICSLQYHQLFLGPEVPVHCFSWGLPTLSRLM